MLIGFTGHRDWLCDHQSLLRIEQRYPGATWVHGGADGFDTQVHGTALFLGKVLDDTLIVIRPDYDSYPPKVAPLMRNDIIVTRSDLIIACWDGRKAGGTYYTINRARQARKLIGYVTPTARVK